MSLGFLLIFPFFLFSFFSFFSFFFFFLAGKGEEELSF